MSLKPKIAGAIIAGGKSTRFGQSDKANALLNDKPLIEWVMSRLEPQVNQLIINRPEAQTSIPENYAYTQDFVSGQTGPLNGVLACLSKSAELGHEWLQIAPCDTPLIPEDLCEKLMAKAEQGYALCIPRLGNQAHPSLSLWNLNLLEPLKDAVVNKGMQGFRQFYPTENFSFVDWDMENYDPFLNINNQSDLKKAEELIALYI